MERTKAVFNWSGGKDSAHALWRAIESQRYEIVALLTTVNHDTRRSTMHGIPFPLLQAQAASIGIPLHAVDLTPKGDMEDYQTAMSQAVAHFKAQGVTHFIFGDIFLHDVRKYREQQLAPHGIEVVEPLWGRSSETVMHDFLASGLQTVVVTTMATDWEPQPSGGPSTPISSPPCLRGRIPTAKTENTTPSVTTARFSARPSGSGWGVPSPEVTTYGSTTARRKPTPTGSPICKSHKPSMSPTLPMVCLMVVPGIGTAQNPADRNPHEPPPLTTKKDLHL